MLARMWWRGATWRPAGLRRDRRVMVLRFAGVGCTSTRQLGVDAPAQLLGAERFRDVVVRAELEAPIDVGVLTARGEQDDRYVCSCWVRAKVGKDLESGELRHHHIEDAEIRAFRLRERESRLAVGCADNAVAVVFETEANEIEDVLLVVNDEDGLGRGRRGLHPYHSRLNE